MATGRVEIIVENRFVVGQRDTNTDGGLKKWLVNLDTNVPKLVTQLEITPRAAHHHHRLVRLAHRGHGCAGTGQTRLAGVLPNQTNPDRHQPRRPARRSGQMEVGRRYDRAIAAELQIVGGGTPFNPETYQPQITANAFSSYVRIKFKKLGADGINLYTRLKDTTGWRFVSRDTNSPYDDHTPLAVAGQSEAREYQAFGVLNDEKIGQPSDIVSVTFAC